jgi:diguanylate cyclase (GGDEF)-like protein
MGHLMTSASSPPQRRVVVFIAAVVACAVALTYELVVVDFRYGFDNVSWITFALVSGLLILGEIHPGMVMRFGESGEITPGWTFAYALVLFGCASGAVGVMALTTIYVGLSEQKGLLKIAFNVGQIAIALSSGGLILHLFGLHDGITLDAELPLQGGLGIVLGALAVFLVNGLLTATVIGLHRGDGFVQTLRTSFALSMTADGALLALAPVFVIAIDYSIVMVPLLAVTSYLVFYSARNAIRREHEASHDPLTMLLNRRAFDQRVTAAIDAMTDEQGVAVMVMDLDRFKDINDRLGHQVGDRLLVSFAERLERSIPATACASRLGGDEFGVMIPGITDLNEARAIVLELNEVLGRPHDLDGFPLSVGVSIGVAIGPAQGRTGDALIAGADVAMYRAKRYDTGVDFGTKSSSSGDHGRIGLLYDLPQAIANAEIRAHYQPQIDLQTGGVDGVEALMRWTHPKYGPISPNDFIGVAEQTDLIGPITEAMLYSSMSEMLSLGADMPNLAVNVAPRSLLDRQFAHQVLRIIEELGFPPDRLEIEITERAIVTGSERTALTLGQLREAGVTVAIDDFGTGYSSFSILRDLRVDRVKIDRQFTSELLVGEADDLIVTKVIELAHGLGLGAVAEGVESEQVWARLRELGCDAAQGFAIGRPMPLADLRSWLRRPPLVPRDTTVHAKALVS